MSNSKLTIYVMVGAPGSGKSTAAERIYKNSPGTTAIVSRDRLRTGLFGGDYKFSKSRETQVSNLKDYLIADNTGNPEIKTIIIDETHCTARGRNKTINFINELKESPSRNIEVLYLFAEDSLNVDLCHKRNIARDAVVPFEVLENMHKGLIDFLRSDPSGQELAKVYAHWLPSQDSTESRQHLDAYIVDIDGTLADHTGVRSPFDWESVGEDRPKQDVIDVVNALSKNNEIIIFSGRDGSCYDETKQWLIDHGIQFDQLHLRAAGDSRKDYIIKMELYSQHVAGQYNVRGVFDDRLQVVRYWRALGLTVFQVDLGLF